MKSVNGWMKVWAAVALGLWARGVGAAEIRNVTAAYAWPWGAEIRYEVLGTLEPEDALFVTATDWENNVTYMAETSALSGDTGIEEGEHQVMWDLDKQGVRIQSTNVVFAIEYRPALYCVVDLSGGPNVPSYSVSYTNAPPNGGWTDEYKMTKLVLRRIEPGTFTMGDIDYSNNPPHQVTLTKPFYIGVFVVTQREWDLVMGGGSGSQYYMNPEERESWTSCRAFASGLRTRTGLNFDLPTDAQWEYACRAGTTTKFSYGDNANGDYMWYNGSNYQGWLAPAVGLKLPNAWGLYDMHGNVREWCLDWYGPLSEPATDPVGPSSGKYRVMRGGNYSDGAWCCWSSYRASKVPESSDAYVFDGVGFRVVRTMSE